jgi:hypothetical protein
MFRRIEETKARAMRGLRFMYINLSCYLFCLLGVWTREKGSTEVQERYGVE